MGIVQKIIMGVGIIFVLSGIFAIVLHNLGGGIFQIVMGIVLLGVSRLGRRKQANVSD